MTKGHLKVGKQGTELNRIKYQLQIMGQYFIRLSQNLAYDNYTYCLELSFISLAVFSVNKTDSRSCVHLR